MIHDELVVFRLIVAGVLLTAALSKHAAAAASSQPSGGMPLRNILLRATEFLVALALLPGNTARLGFVGAAVLAAGFVAAHAFPLSRGSVGGCGCFGSLDRDLSPLVSLFRACMLFALAAVGAALSWKEASPHIWIWLGQRGIADQVGVILGVGTIVVPFAVPGRIGAVLSRLRHGAWETLASRSRPALSGFQPGGPAVGSVAPCWRELFDRDRDGRAVMLVFLSETSNDARPPDIPCHGMRLLRVPVPVGRTSALADLYQVRALPSALVLSADGVVLSRLAVGSVAIDRLCSQGAIQTHAAFPVAFAQHVRAAATGCEPCRS